MGFVLCIFSLLYLEKLSSLYKPNFRKHKAVVTNNPNQLGVIKATRTLNTNLYLREVGKSSQMKLLRYDTIDTPVFLLCTHMNHEHHHLSVIFCLHRGALYFTPHSVIVDTPDSFITIIY